MLLVQLTALVVWLAQYVSAADYQVGPFIKGDFVHAKINQNIMDFTGNEYFDPYSP